jgi:DNA uptake protein ComE-like DNA-binding protein
VTENNRDKRILVLFYSALVFLMIQAVQASTVNFHNDASDLSLSTDQLIWSEGAFLTKAGASFVDTYDLKSLPPEITPFFFQPIPINFADTHLLATINGIGPHLAAEIVRDREGRGFFRNRDDLLRVSGLGPKRIAQIEGQLSFASDRNR